MSCRPRHSIGIEDELSSSTKYVQYKYSCTAAHTTTPSTAASPAMVVSSKEAVGIINSAHITVATTHDNHPGGNIIPAENVVGVDTVDTGVDITEQRRLRKLNKKLGTAKKAEKMAAIGAEGGSGATAKKKRDETWLKFLTEFGYTLEDYKISCERLDSHLKTDGPLTLPKEKGEINFLHIDIDLKNNEFVNRYINKDWAANQAAQKSNQKNVNGASSTSSSTSVSSNTNNKTIKTKFRACLWHRPSSKSLEKLRSIAKVTHIISLLKSIDFECRKSGLAREPDFAAYMLENAVEKHRYKGYEHIPVDGARADILGSTKTWKNVRKALLKIVDWCCSCDDEAVAKVDDTSDNTHTMPTILIHCSAGMHRTGFFGYSVLRLLGGYNMIESYYLLSKMRMETYMEVSEDRVRLAEEFVKWCLLRVTKGDEVSDDEEEDDNNHSNQGSNINSK